MWFSEFYHSYWVTQLCYSNEKYKLTQWFDLNEMCVTMFIDQRLCGSESCEIVSSLLYISRKKFRTEVVLQGFLD